MIQNAEPRQKYLRLNDKSTVGTVFDNARHEVNETGTKYQQLEDLKIKLRGAKNPKIRLEDEFLWPFLRVSKFSVSKAADRVVNFYKQLNRCGDVFGTSLDKALLSSKQYTHFTASPYRMPDNGILTIHKFGTFDPRVMSFDEMFLLDNMVLSSLMDDEATQLCGLHCVTDLSGFSLASMLEHTPRRLKFRVDTFQKTLPMRVKSVHLINAPSLFYVFFRLVSTFMSRKMQNRFHVYPPDGTFKGLHACVPPEILPKEYGGHLDKSEFVDLISNVCDLGLKDKKQREENFRNSPVFYETLKAFRQ